MKQEHLTERSDFTTPKWKRLANGDMIPTIGLGTWQLLGVECTQAVQMALSLGYNHIDTAESYENEEAIAAGLHNVDRDKLFLTSKVWHENLTPEDVHETCRASLRRLQTDYLNLYMIHWPQQGTNYAEVLRAFKELKEEGLIRGVGVCNFTIAHLKDVLPIAADMGLQILVNQVEFHPALYQADLLSFCQQNDIVVIAYSPLGRQVLLNNSLLQAVARDHRCSISQVCLRWLLQHDLCAIPKASTYEHLKDNIEVFDFTLSADAMKQIDAMGQEKRLIDPEYSEFDYGQTYAI